MDLLPSPNPVVTNLMGSDFVKIPELETEKLQALSPPPLIDSSQLKAAHSPISPTAAWSGPPTLKPAPTAMEEISKTATSATIHTLTAKVALPQPEVKNVEAKAVQPAANQLQFGVGSAGSIPTAPTPAPPAVTPVPQIMTRKRSSMSAVSSAMLFGTSATGSSGTDLSSTSTSTVSASTYNPPAEVLAAQQPAQPPKKKKKYTPKPKKAPETVAANGINPTGGGNTGSKPPAPSKSKSKKAPEPATGTTLAVGANDKSKKPSKPKAPRPPRPRQPAGGSSKSKSKKGKAGSPPQMSDAEAGANQLVPPLKLPLPKLLAAPGAPATQLSQTVVPKVEPQDWDENGDQVDPTEAELIEDGSDELGNGKGGSRKKKSKGRNGNIYIGVFNRIEWMKLQTEFGFGSVNNFGTFVLQTMSRVHGDIQFWCDVAVASGVYAELDHYEWENGFPHAVNKEGQRFTPELDVTMSDDKREEVIEMAKAMWDQRLQKLKQQQQQLMGEEEEVTLLDTVPEEGEEEDDEEDEPMPDLENYLQNMASGQYSPTVKIPEGVAGAISEMAPQADDSGKATTSLTEEDVNRIWNEQLNDSESLEKFGKLFSFINSIATMGKKHENEQNGKMEGSGKADQTEQSPDLKLETKGVMVGGNGDGKVTA